MSVSATQANKRTALLPPHPCPLPATPTTNINLLQEKMSLAGGNIPHHLTIHLANLRAQMLLRPYFSKDHFRPHLPVAGPWLQACLPGP